ncbi:adenylyltransferase/cytidyltransferase family protein [Haloechinothrix sp. YIM 98757]|uniref:Adenylyltransferase/cytidyltransferase family protein n=1 Tax=Haloechinothrix aidingensis TaxID=2752311 RepID=A0A838AA74_9PSEU|nr:adenylyltransferase/cytidyltransferase family protein [Haloechinothrix aidingensis]MBA0126049.1 adenylyltransferase/cytidyltransferase family protein [Haloechinothrix aidingensis]
MSIIGYAPGAYDLFHIGHLNLLRHASERCDHLVAGVVTDDVLEAAKAQRPVIPLHERIEIVRNIRYVDDAVADPYVDKFESWRRYRFDVLFKGDDWRDTPAGRRLEALLSEVGARVVYFPYTVHTSSTALRRFIAMSGSQSGSYRETGG